MCSLMKAAPALVPATGTPAAFMARTALATGVPPSSVDSRSWLPPVKKTPLARCRRSMRLVSSQSRRVSKSMAVTRAAPRSPKMRS